MVLTIFLSSCFDEENYHTKTDTDALLKTLEDALTEKIAANEAAITALKTEYEEKVKALENESAVLEADLAALEKKHNEDKAALIAKNDATQAELDALEEKYATDLEALQKADTDNAAAIEALTKKHNEDKAALIAKNDATQAELDALTSTYNTAVAGINNKLAANETAIKNAKTELQSKLDTLAADHDAELAAVNDLIDALQDADTASEARLAELEKQVADLLASQKHTFGDWIILVDAMCETKGVKMRICPCGASEAKEIPAIGHTYDAENTCTGCLDYKDKCVVFTLQEDNTYAVTDYTGDATEVIIPSKYQGVAVTSIGKGAFSGCSGLTNITIPDSVTSIGFRAFRRCSGLTSITIGNGVTSIGNRAFMDCSGLETISVASGNTVYHSAENCLIETASKKLVLGCKNSIIPTDGSVTSIGDDAFSGCSGLTSITIPHSVTFIGSNAFGCCYNLETITVDSRNPKYHSAGNCLIDTTRQTLILGCKNSIIPNDSSVTSINSAAFTYCHELTSITIPSSIVSISDNAFFGCDKLIEVYNLSSLNITPRSSSYGYIAYGAKNVYTSTTQKSKLFTDNSGYLFYDGETERYLMGYIGADTALILPTSCNGKNYDIYHHAFYLRDDITSLIIPNGIVSINHFAFAYCKKLTSITIPSSVISIKSSAFHNCNSLTTLTIPSSITFIDNNAFLECSGLESITVKSGNSKYHSAGNCLIDTASKTLLLGCKNSVIPSNGSVTTINNNAFRNCSELKNITIPNSVTSIGSSAFSGCSGLTSITIPSNVTSIGSHAFSGCSGLTSITIPNSITSIEEALFSACYSLTNIKYHGTEQQWNAISKGDYWNANTGNYTITYNYTGE